MSAIARRPIRIARRLRASGGWGAFLAVIALISQLALGTAVFAQDEVAQALAQAAIQCAGNTQPDGAPAPRHHRAGDPALCPLTVALALPAYLPSAPPILPAPPVASVFSMTERPPARGPPAASARVGAPRGPPTLT